MTSSPVIEPKLRDRILTEPEVILEDQDVMRALVAANERSMGGNIVDLRGIAMERLEARLDRLEDTHRHVIAAAYENMSGTNQVHRAVLSVMSAQRFDDMLLSLSSKIPEILRVDAARLVLESSETAPEEVIARTNHVLQVARVGGIDSYVRQGRPVPPRQVTLRHIMHEGRFYGELAEDIRSEACLRLNLGNGRLPGLLLLGSQDPHMFTTQQGTDLLAFFANTFELVLQRWLG